MLQFTCSRREVYCYAALILHMNDACSKEREDIVSPITPPRPVYNEKGFIIGRRCDFRVAYQGRTIKVKTDQVNKGQNLWCIIMVEDL